MKKILITGVTGFIGKAILNKLLNADESYKIFALIRPNTKSSRFQEFGDKIEISSVDLADSASLRLYLEKHIAEPFDFVLHIGALRGGRNFPHKQYYLSNVIATEILVEYCTIQKSVLLFCSSVGVFGAIPEEMPANNNSPRIADNYYHYTKIEAEKRINKAVMSGLHAAVLRPSITYGKGDYGFPYQLVKMIRNKRFPLITKRTWIHLCHIDTISDAFVWLLKNEFESGLALNVADREPVQLRDLVNFISRQLFNKNYTLWMQFDRKLFSIFETVFRFLKSELWISRIELISKSWYYDVSKLYDLMQLTPRFTIPGIEIVIREFKK